MSDLSKLKEVLDNQAERGITSGDWDRLTYLVEKSTDGEPVLKLHDLAVGFVFTKAGRLIGAYNWKQ